MTPYETEENRLRYFLNLSKVDPEGLENVIRCFKEAHAAEVANGIADSLERVHVRDLPGPRAYRHWVRLALNRQAAAIRRQR